MKDSGVNGDALLPPRPRTQVNLTVSRTMRLCACLESIPPEHFLRRQQSCLQEQPASPSGGAEAARSESSDGSERLDSDQQSYTPKKLRPRAARLPNKAH